MDIPSAELIRLRAEQRAIILDAGRDPRWKMRRLYNIKMAFSRCWHPEVSLHQYDNVFYVCNYCSRYSAELPPRASIVLPPG